MTILKKEPVKIRRWPRYSYLPQLRNSNMTCVSSVCFITGIQKNIRLIFQLSGSVSTTQLDFGPTYRQRFPADNSDEDSLQSKTQQFRHLPNKSLVRLQPEENERKIWFLGPFVFYDDEKHIIDNVAKLLFPLLFLILNAIYFLFHRFHPDTVT